MVEPSKCPHLEVVGVNGKTWVDEGGGRTEDEEDQGKFRRARWDSGVKKVKRGLEDEGCHERNISCRQVGKHLVSRGKCVKSKRDIRRRRSRRVALETQGAIKKTEENKGNKWKKRPPCLNNICVVEVKTRRRRRRRVEQQRHRVLLWLALLLFSLQCPNMALAQVGISN